MAGLLRVCIDSAIGSEIPSVGQYITIWISCAYSREVDCKR